LSHVVVVSDTTFFRREYAVEILLIKRSIQSTSCSVCEEDESLEDDESSPEKPCHDKSIPLKADSNDIFCKAL